MRALLPMIVLAACGGASDYRVTRVIDGQARSGPYVSPYAYEAFVEGELLYNRGHYGEALGAYARARTGPRDDRFVVARMVACRLRLEELEAAEALYQEGLSMSDSEGGPPSEALFLVGAEVALSLSRPAQVHARLLEAHALSEGQSEAAQWASDVAFEVREQEDDLGPAALAAVHRALSEMDQRRASTHARFEHAVLEGDAEASRRALEAMEPALRSRLRNRRFELARRALSVFPEVALVLVQGDRDERGMETEIRALVALGRLDAANARIAQSLVGHADRSRFFAIAGSDELAYSEGQAALPSDEAAFVLALAQVAARLGHRREARELLAQITAQDAEFEQAESLRQTLAPADPTGR